MQFNHPDCAESIRGLLARVETPLLTPKEARAFTQLENWLYAIQMGVLVVAEPVKESPEETPDAQPEKPAAKK